MKPSILLGGQQKQTGQKPIPSKPMESHRGEASQNKPRKMHLQKEIMLSIQD